MRRQPSRVSANEYPARDAIVARVYPASQMSNDFRFALRSLRRRPAFTAAVFLTLALGIGTSTAVFSLLDAALIRPLPFADPSGIVMLSGVYGP